MARSVIRGSWRYVGTETGETWVPLPNDSTWSELFVEVAFPLNEKVAWLFNVPRIAIVPDGNSWQWLQNGGSGTDTQMVGINVNSTRGVNVREYYRNGVEMHANAKFRVYVR